MSCCAASVAMALLSRPKSAQTKMPPAGSQKSLAPIFSSARGAVARGVELAANAVEMAAILSFGEDAGDDVSLRALIAASGQPAQEEVRRLRGRPAPGTIDSLPSYRLTKSGG